MTDDLTHEQWRRICALLDEMMDLPRDRWKARLEDCGGDDDLRWWVRTLLEAAESAGGFLEQPVLPAMTEVLRKIAPPAGPVSPPAPCSAVGREPAEASAAPSEDADDAGAPGGAPGNGGQHP